MWISRGVFACFEWLKSEFEGWSGDDVRRLANRSRGDPRKLSQ